VNEVKRWIQAVADLQMEVADTCADDILTAVKTISESLQTGNKVLLCGNGGSAADCQHMATELMVRLSKETERPGLAAIALTTDTSLLTAYANDYAFDGVFERQVQALGRPRDVLVAISTSGRSENVLRAVREARRKEMATVALVGRGGQLASLADCAIVIPSDDTQHIQEALLPVEHLICMLVERSLYGGVRA
jgi:D-sedoheptulose 7-phosphate isomerase